MGGAESLAVSFAQAVRGREVDLTMCARTSIGGNPLAIEIDAEAKVENLNARTLRDVRAFRRLLRLIRERNIDVIHAHLTYSAIWAALASRVTGVPVVATLHVSPPDRAGWREDLRQRLLVALLNRYAARVVMVSSAQRDSWGGRLRNAVVVHNGVPVPDTAAAMSRDAATVPRILTVAVLREGKGIDVLIDAVRTLQERGETIEVAVAGDGPQREMLMHRAAGLPIQWLGFRRDVAALLQRADVFVLPTLADAFPTVLLEAMAAGKPVIASRVGGAPEIVDDGTTGILVPPGDAQALSDAIGRAVRDERWLAAAGAAARVRYEQAFTVEHWIERLERLYRDVLRERVPARAHPRSVRKVPS